MSLLLFYFRLGLCCFCDLLCETQTLNARKHPLYFRGLFSCLPPLQTPLLKSKRLCVTMMCVRVCESVGRTSDQFKCRERFFIPFLLLHVHGGFCKTRFCPPFTHFFLPSNLSPALLRLLFPFFLVFHVWFWGKKTHQTVGNLQDLLLGRSGV